ncbi:dihydropteroate synthase [Hydrocarboniclastica marina]|uniref:Dihydropteroate synthase n=2 Tax=Hydrocarboniclastica marina TaxID=2259620 RepID=A0A4V1D943_9ALTE|nr:dihydropteroate synthase [Hydrocarboniclastica marina]
MQMQFASHSLDLSRPQVMGILNVTPDSFSDGGRYNSLDSALAHAERMMSAGATFIDIGGESTRPGADPVSTEQELNRVCPVVEAIRKNLDVVVSVDTSTPEVMRETARLGAGMINDVRGLQRDGAVKAAADTGLPVCIMHMQGQPKTMQTAPSYDDPVQDVLNFLKERIAVVEEAGIPRSRLILDPGFGFGKSLVHNLTLLASLRHFLDQKLPVLIGVSRKSMLGEITGRGVDERCAASIAAATLAAWQGAQIFRVHDVAETVDALKVVAALKGIEK